MILNKEELSLITKALRHERDRQISMKLDPFNTKELLDKCRDEKDKLEVISTNEAIDEKEKVFESTVQKHPITGEELDGYGNQV